ncbi:MAG TPA: hypothetical protein VHM93_10660 [Candidatus Acidoferrum sp.]|jgi:hypothetical protein|nr:hypothetical protein [Candidatus Acidoferrum sp.]
MATVATQSRYPVSARRLQGRRYNSGFFAVVAILVLVTVSIGSGPTGYFALAVRAKVHLKGHTFPATQRFANPITVNQ